jgi:hypothetical protein
MAEPRLNCYPACHALHICAVLFVSFLGWLILPILGSRQRVLDHNVIMTCDIVESAVDLWRTPRAVLELAESVSH